MKVITASELKRYTADILNTVTFGRIPVLIKRHERVIAKIVPEEKEAGGEKKRVVKTLLEKYWGVIPDFPEVVKLRKNRRWRKIFA